MISSHLEFKCHKLDMNKAASFLWRIFDVVNMVTLEILLSQELFMTLNFPDDRREKKLVKNLLHPYQYGTDSHRYSQTYTSC